MLISKVSELLAIQYLARFARLLFHEANLTIGYVSNKQHIGHLNEVNRVVMYVYYIFSLYLHYKTI